ncbi:MAG: mucoidy inhibitor MuiA family protein [Planctomycetes bacterium]|nr:mucoidy inhibitor MuiA family protein [Planctomycetota bacterium]
MKKRLVVPLCALAVVGGLVGAGAVATLRSARAEAAKKKADAAADIKLAASRIVHVTVYQNNALVTREVDVPEGTGTLELVVSPLPAQTVNTSLYSEGAEGMRVLTTRFRLRPVKEDTREEVRRLEGQVKELQNAGQKIQSDIMTIEQNMAMIGKLENFTSASATAATEKGKLDGDQIITLSDYVMKQRNEKAKELVGLKHQMQDNQEQVEFKRRQLGELTSGTSKVERDAIIVVDKANNAAGKVRLNYLVSSAGWRPQYRFRAGKEEKESVQLEYLAGVIQQTGEDWGSVKLTLSTAQPMLNAAPPDLRVLQVSLMPRGAIADGKGFGGFQGFQGGGGGFPPIQPAPGGQAMPQVEMPNKDFQAAVEKQSKELRSQSAQEYNLKKAEVGGRLINDAAALEQSNEILWKERDELLARRSKAGRGPVPEGQSVTYHLASKLTVPSRNEEQVLEVARIELKPEFCYKAVPVLTRHVYRLANLTNTSENVLLPGEATMYINSDFVGRMDLPLIAIGEEFTAGFGVDPQLQVEREMLDKQKTQQGGNQVLKYEYRILVSSYKAKPVKVQVWDRLPKTEQETVNVTVLKATPEVCGDPVYLRQQKPHNLLRWDLTVEPNMRGEKAKEIHYEFKVELDRQMTIGGFQSK